jgi:hypothetical protein
VEQKSMETQDRQDAPAIFLRRVIVAVSELKLRLQRDYQRMYPGLKEIIRIILDEEEANAWKLSIFPHLLLPDLLEAHIETLGLKLADTITSGAAELDECLTAA